MQLNHRKTFINISTLDLDNGLKLMSSFPFLCRNILRSAREKKGENWKNWIKTGELEDLPDETCRICRNMEGIWFYYAPRRIARTD
ncbi:MAG: hypothetical protein IPO21_08750 [Bacteroidales bacterium]|nr:hypothetical protein [Bacteroidales bacterium]